MDEYLDILLQNGNLPASICLYTDSAKLVCEGSPMIEQLRAIETKGVRLIVFSAHLSCFEPNEKVQAGIVSRMSDIAKM